MRLEYGRMLKEGVAFLVGILGVALVRKYFPKSFTGLVEAITGAIVVLLGSAIDHDGVGAFVEGFGAGLFFDGLVGIPQIAVL